MADYTHYEIDSAYSGLTLYAKSLPLNTATWATGIVPLTEDGSTGQFSATLDDATKYAIYQQAGGSPADSDVTVGTVGAVAMSAASAIYQPTGRLFRVVASGGNASGNFTFSDPGTLAAALAAASHGDTISLAAGAYTFGVDEQADLSSVSHVTLMGDSADTTSLVGTDAVFVATLGDYCRLLHLTLDNTASGDDFAAVLGNGATGCEIGYCVLRGTGDALFGNAMTNAWIHHTTATGTWDAVVGLADRCLIEFCDFATDGTNVGTTNSVALALGDACTVRNCKLTATRASSTSSKVRGLAVSGDCLIESCEIIATQSNAGSTGDAIGIEALAGATVTVLGGRQVVTNAGAGAETKIDATATGADKIDFGTVPEEVLATFNADSDYIALKSNVTGLGASLVIIDSKTSDAKAASESADTKLSTARLAKVDNLLASGTYATDADVAAGTTGTPLYERPMAPNRTRKVYRTAAGGLTFDTIVVRIGDDDAAWCLDFAGDLIQGAGISSAENAIGAPSFSPGSGLAVAETPVRSADRGRGVILKFDPTTAGSYTMTMSVTYGDSQGTHTVQGPVTVVAGAG